MGQNALHLAAKTASYSLEMNKFIEFLIESGLDVTSKDKVAREHFYNINYLNCQFQEGKAPHHVALDGKMRQFLRQHYVWVTLSLLKCSLEVLYVGHRSLFRLTREGSPRFD